MDTGEFTSEAVVPKPRVETLNGVPALKLMVSQAQQEFHITAGPW